MTDLQEERLAAGPEGVLPEGSGTAALPGISGLSCAARRYALWELARRSGVSAEFFRSWRVSVHVDETVVCMDADGERCIRFPHAPRAFWQHVAVGRFHTVRAGWMVPPPDALRRLVPELIVPFADRPPGDRAPLFSRVDSHQCRCSLDLLAALLLTLSRFEESVSPERDAYDCFPPSRSVAVREQFLDRPVVDEWGLAFEQALCALLPGWRPVERRLRVKISHDIDWVGAGSSVHSALLFGAHLVRHHGPSAAGRELWRWLGRREPTCLEMVREIARLSLDRGLDSAVYWMAAPPSRRDPGYDPRHRSVVETMAWLRGHGVEMGVHPGYHTFGSPERLRREVELLRQVLGERWMGGRQHYLRWSPESWVHWEMCGLAYDSSVGYADRIGFRAGTCFPYRPWLLGLDREARLLEIPLLVMNGTLTHFMKLTPPQSREAVAGLVTRCRAVGGVFTLLWHNDSLIDPSAAALYHELLDSIAGSDRFDWKAAAGPNSVC